MGQFLKQLKWEFVLLQKNNIINISLVVTFIYAGILFFLRDAAYIDKVLVSGVLNDPSVIGYFFIALAIYGEMKHDILPAVFVSPVKLNNYLIAKVLAISIIGLICSLILAFAIRGLDFSIALYSLGSFGICLMSSLLGIIMLTMASEFLKFAMLSVPMFLIFINVPMLQYLGAFDLGIFKYIFPIQGSVDLIDYSITGTNINIWASMVTILFFTPILYFLAHKFFKERVVHI